MYSVAKTYLLDARPPALPPLLGLLFALEPEGSERPRGKRRFYESMFHGHFVIFFQKYFIVSYVF